MVDLRGWQQLDQVYVVFCTIEGSLADAARSKSVSRLSCLLVQASDNTKSPMDGFRVIFIQLVSFTRFFSTIARVVLELCGKESRSSFHQA